MLICMKPYYEHKGITIYHGDCREILSWCHTNKMLEQIDMVLTDPPYNAANIGPNARVYELQQMQLSPCEYQYFCEDWFRLAQLFTDRLIFTCGISNLWLYPPAKWVLCWHKPSAISFNRMGGFNAWEPILVYGKTPGRFGQDYIRQDPLNFTKGPEKHHPCPKPMKVWMWLVYGGSAAGEMILDPFMGSGTTLRAAKDAGRRAIGIEISERYCEIATKRLKQEVFDFGGRDLRGPFQKRPRSSLF